MNDTNDTSEIIDEKSSEAGDASLETEEPVDPAARIEQLEEEIKTEHERLLRATADLDNYRKRSRREVEEAAVRGRTEILREILPVIDSIDLALSSADPEGPATGIIEGVEMVRKQFLSATERFGLAPVESIGKAFDPNFHEAVGQAPSDQFEPGQVMEEMRKGYVLGDRLLRASMVIVTQPETVESVPDTPSQSPSETSDGGETARDEE